MKEKVLVLYSGGYDSTLMALRLMKGYEVHLLNFQTIGTATISTLTVYGGVQNNEFNKKQISSATTRTAKELCDRFPELIYDGNLSNISAQREINKIFANIPFGELNPNITQNQLNCLICRSSMYAEAIIYALKNGFNMIYDGARESQNFAIENDKLIASFNKYLFNQYNLCLLTPLIDYKANDFERLQALETENITLFANHAFSDKCLLGMPVDEKPSQDCIDAIDDTFINNISPVLINYIEKTKDKKQKTYYGPNVFN